MTFLPLHASSLLKYGPGRADRPRSVSATGDIAGLAGRVARMMMPAPAAVGRSGRGQAATTEAVEGTVSDRTDENLLAEHLAGDPTAFRELTERYSRELIHFLTRFLGSRAAAEDVFQETFLQVHTSAETFDGARRFKPWLFTIAANKARDY